MNESYVDRRRAHNLVAGDRFGKLVALRPTASTWARGCATWLMRCDCGREVARPLHRLSDVSYCGHCRARADLVESRTPEYIAWQQMRRRCHGRSGREKHYGGRGIRVCDEWRGPGGFRRFINHVGRRPSAGHSIDRIDVNGHYEPGNVRWATDIEQSRNKTNNRVITIGGRSATVAEWSESSPVRSSTVARRLDDGWSPEDAVYTQPHATRTANLTVDGVTMRQCDWARALGVREYTVRRRSKAGDLDFFRRALTKVA